MAGFPDFSKYERERRHIPGLDADANEFMQNLYDDATQMFSEIESPNIDPTEYKKAYAEAMDDRARELAVYMQNTRTEGAAAYIKEKEGEHYGRFCECIHALLHASPDEHGPKIAKQIADMILRADASQAAINIENGGTVSQPEVQRIVDYVFELFVRTTSDDMQILLEQFYKTHIHDVAVRYVDSHL